MLMVILRHANSKGLHAVMVRAFVFLLGLGLIFVSFFIMLRGRGAEDVGWSGGGDT
jgi:hypothetical protein